MSNTNGLEVLSTVPSTLWILAEHVLYKLFIGACQMFISIQLSASAAIRVACRPSRPMMARIERECMLMLRCRCDASSEVVWFSLDAIKVLGRRM